MKKCLFIRRSCGWRVERLCDIFLISCLDWAIFYELELTKNMTKYRDDIINRPAYSKAMDINYST